MISKRMTPQTPSTTSPPSPSEHLYLEMLDSPSPPRPPTRRCQVSNFKGAKKNDIVKQKEGVLDILYAVFHAALDAKFEGH